MPQLNLPFLIDTHCHLDFHAFNKDRIDIINKARQAGITRILNPGIDVESSRVVVKLSEAHPEIYAAVGVHPNDALGYHDNAIDELRVLAKNPKVVAIGEIGLDYYRDRAPISLQQHILLEQLQLASDLNLPVVIHSRNANTDIIQILADWYTQLVKNGSLLVAHPGVLHSFSGDEKTAQQALEKNFFIGITGPITFLNSHNLQQLVTNLPLESLLVETDAPFLTPYPHRGQRNEPVYVKLVVEKIAALHNKPFPIVAETIRQNAVRLFNW